MKRSEQYRICFTMKTEGEEAEVMVYSEISNEKWWGDETTTGEFDKALKEARKSGARNLNIRINSPGGEVYAAVAMRSMVINSGFENVRIMIEGLCASAATLFATIPGAHVVIAEGSEFMIHNPMTITWGNADEIQKTVDHLHKMEEQFNEMYSIKTGYDPQVIKEWMDDTTWFTAKEAVENGFCDELLASEPIAACVSKEDMALMKDIYDNVPDDIKVYATGGVVALEKLANKLEENLKAIDEIGELFSPNDGNGVDPDDKEISNETPVAGESSEINPGKEEEPEMELENLTMDQLQEGNAGLVDKIRADAIAAERARLADIDALTVPGYEDLAEQAKADGTSVIDFQKQIVAAMKAKGSEFITARQNETAPAQDVAGGDPVNNGKTEEQKIQDIAKDIAKYANSMADSDNGMF